MTNESIDNIYKILAENQTIIMKNQANFAEMKDFMYKLDKKIDNVGNKIDNVRNELNDKIEKLDKKIDNVRTELNEKIEKLDKKIEYVDNKIDNVDNKLSNFKDEVSDFFINDIIPYINPNSEKRLSYLESIAEAHGYSRVCEDEEDYNCD